MFITFIFKTRVEAYFIITKDNKMQSVKGDEIYLIHCVLNCIKGVITRSMVDALLELCSPFLKRSNSAFIAAIASGLCPQTEYRSLK